jgi:germacradienol/geosmin synthase
MSRQAAINHAAHMVETRMADFKHIESRMPDLCRELRLTTAEANDVSRGVEAAHNWIRGNHDWGLRTGRYTNEGGSAVLTHYIDDLLVGQAHA